MLACVGCDEKGLTWIKLYVRGLIASVCRVELQISYRNDPAEPKRFELRSFRLRHDRVASL